MRQFSSQNYISQHMEGYSLMWMQNITHSEPGGCYFQDFVFLTSSKHANPHTVWQETKCDHMIPLHVNKEFNSLWSLYLITLYLRSTPAHSGYAQWLLSNPYSVKLLPFLQWMASFRNTRNFGEPWSTQEGHSFMQRFSEGQNSAHFLHWIEHIQSEWLKTVPQSDFWDSSKFLQISEWQIEKEKSHIHIHKQTHKHKKVRIS
jgi:hypothetical protein